MKRKIEATYGKALKGIMFAVNPLKKTFLKTYCTIHKFINIQALDILKNEGYTKEYDYFRGYIADINKGVTWADQDFKSSNHFYHFSKGKGLYGFSDALTLCKKYYNISLAALNKNEIEKAMFYLGASIHLVQDTTVPQHVNNKLLGSHRGFELWIISKFMTDYAFCAETGTIRYKKLDDYIKTNALMANNTFLKYMNIPDREERYWKISTAIISEAERTTAGMFLDYYSIIVSKNNIA